MEKKTVSRKLPVKLTKDEILEISLMLAKDTQDLSEIENSKKEVLSDFTAQINRIKAQIEIEMLIAICRLIQKKWI